MQVKFKFDFYFQSDCYHSSLEVCVCHCVIVCLLDIYIFQGYVMYF